MLVKFTGLVENLVVDEARMLANLEATRGLVFSQAVLLALVGKGLERDAAYRIVQRNALAAWEGDRHLHELLAVDPDVTLSDDELAGCFSPDRFLENAGVVFERLEAVEL
jgi:adenylosuccinate lyase